MEQFETMYPVLQSFPAAGRLASLLCLRRQRQRAKSHQGEQPEDKDPEDLLEFPLPEFQTSIRRLEDEIILNALITSYEYILLQSGSPLRASGYAGAASV
jgi:hypothetical protein